jgi:hypothetical protein
MLNAQCKKYWFLTILFCFIEQDKPPNAKEAFRSRGSLMINNQCSMLNVKNIGFLQSFFCFIVRVKSLN